MHEQLRPVGNERPVKTLWLISFVLSLFMVNGCAAHSVQELKASPGYHKTIVAPHGYQQSLKIIKDEYASIQGYDLSCTTYTDMKKGECTGTGASGVFIFISTEYKDENASTVDFYTAISNSLWHKNIDKIITKLNK